MGFGGWAGGKQAVAAAGCLILGGAWKNTHAYLFIGHSVGLLGDL